MPRSPWVHSDSAPPPFLLWACFQGEEDGHGCPLTPCQYCSPVTLLIILRTNPNKPQGQTGSRGTAAYQPGLACVLEVLGARPRPVALGPALGCRVCWETP